MSQRELERQAKRILLLNESLHSRYAKLSALADQFVAALAPIAACHRGCNHCCSMQTLIYRFEAVALAEVTGRAMVELPYRPHDVVIKESTRLPRKECVFLSDGACSVYAHRPMICRVHHSLNRNSSDCKLSALNVPEAPILMHDPDILEVPYHALVRNLRAREPWGLITEFFPPKDGASVSAL